MNQNESHHISTLGHNSVFYNNIDTYPYHDVYIPPQYYYMNQCYYPQYAELYYTHPYYYSAPPDYYSNHMVIKNEITIPNTHLENSDTQTTQYNLNIPNGIIDFDDTSEEDSSFDNLYTYNRNHDCCVIL